MRDRPHSRNDVPLSPDLSCRVLAPVVLPRPPDRAADVWPAPIFSCAGRCQRAGVPDDRRGMSTDCSSGAPYLWVFLFSRGGCALPWSDASFVQEQESSCHARGLRSMILLSTFGGGWGADGCDFCRFYGGDETSLYFSRGEKILFRRGDHVSAKKICGTKIGTLLSSRPSGSAPIRPTLSRNPILQNNLLAARFKRIHLHQIVPLRLLRMLWNLRYRSVDGFYCGI